MKVKLLVLILGQIPILPKRHRKVRLYPQQHRILPAPNNLHRIRITKVLPLLNFNIFHQSTFIDLQITHFHPEFTMVYEEVLVWFQLGF